MAETSTIEWTDATWNPITGCSVVSPGCTNCYAMRLAGGRLRNHPSRRGLTGSSKAGPVWTGEVRLNEQWIDQPLRWSRPRMIFVCAHGDLFHEKVPDAWIDKVFGVMVGAPHHTFQVLTKRAERMRAYMASFRPCKAATGYVTRNGDEPTSYGGNARDAIMSAARWPLPNVWLGVSAEDQRRADERIPHLLATPAAVRWVSAEPLLGPILLSGEAADAGWNWLTGDAYEIDATPPPSLWAGNTGRRLDWIVAGGESGPDARPMHPAWARSLHDQCKAAGVAFHFKQWGEFAPDDPSPDAHTAMNRVGKARAGRLLDGREHNEFPR